MFLMVEGNRLFRLGPHAQADQEEEHKKTGYESNEEEFHALIQSLDIELLFTSAGPRE